MSEFEKQNLSQIEQDFIEAKNAQYRNTICFGLFLAAPLIGYFFSNGFRLPSFSISVSALSSYLYYGAQGAILSFLLVYVILVFSGFLLVTGIIGSILGTMFFAGLTGYLGLLGVNWVAEKVSLFVASSATLSQWLNAPVPGSSGTVGVAILSGVLTLGLPLLFVFLLLRSFAAVERLAPLAAEAKHQREMDKERRDAARFEAKRRRKEEREAQRRREEAAYERSTRDSGTAFDSPQQFDFFAGCKTLDDLKYSYRALQKLYHPDASTGNEAYSKEINRQYEIRRKEFLDE